MQKKVRVMATGGRIPKAKWTTDVERKPRSTLSTKCGKELGAPVRPKGILLISYIPNTGLGQTAVFACSSGLTGICQYLLGRSRVEKTVHLER